MSACGDCGATWTGARACHCTACHETFSGERAFTMHQGAVTGCTPPAELTSREGAPRLVRNARGLWGEPGPGTDLWARPTAEAEKRSRRPITPRPGPRGQNSETQLLTRQTDTEGA